MVEKFIRRQLRIITEAQPAVFPNAHITGRKPFASCGQNNIVRLVNGRARVVRRRWQCAFFISFYETSRSDPDQWTRRTCRSPDNFEDYTYVRRRSLYSRKLRIVRWRMDCSLDESAISLWNDTGPDWQPNVSEPTTYEPVTARVPKVDDATDGLLPPPSGEPPGLPPGPLSVTRIWGSTSRSALHVPDHVSCSGWNRYVVDPRYWVYGCFWTPHSLPGASPGIFNNVTEYELYYWTGAVDANGWAVARLFYRGIVPQINYVHG